MVIALGQWIVGVVSFQKIYGVYFVQHHNVEKWSGRADLCVWWVSGLWVGCWEIIFERWKPEEEYAEDVSDIAEEIKLLHERSLFAHLDSVCLQIENDNIIELEV